MCKAKQLFTLSLVIVCLGPPTKGSCVVVSWLSSCASRLAGVTCDDVSRVMDVGICRMDRRSPQSLAARRTPGTSWTRPYQRSRWGSWCRESAAWAWREIYSKTMGKVKEGLKTSTYWFYNSTDVLCLLKRKVSSSISHSSQRWTGTHKEPGGETSKQSWQIGKDEDTNRDIIREAKSVNVTVWGRRADGEGEGDGHEREKEPLRLHVSWTAMAVKRRHATLSVKLKTTGAQLTAKTLIVRTPVHSHSRGMLGDMWKVKWRLRLTSPKCQYSIPDQ